MLQIKDTHTDECGKIYQIKNYNCEEVGDIKEVLGEIITESHFTTENTYEENGIYLYHHKTNPNIGFRIYKDYNLYKYVKHSDAEMLSKFKEKQSKITLTEFPKGIITVGNYVIGQEIPYYDGYKPLVKTIYDLKEPKEVMLYYKQIVEILKELCDNKIYYKDLHTGNFIIKDNVIKLIDFDTNFVSFKEDNYCAVLYYLKFLLKDIDKNKLLNIDFKECENLEDIDAKIKSKKL